MIDIRQCREDEFHAIATIINAAAERYRGVIPPDRWQEPYMPDDKLRSEINSGIIFWGAERKGEMVGVMGIQNVRDVVLIRHAYVLPSAQGQGIGSRLLSSLRSLSGRPMLIGTWAAASWAIGFYEGHGFATVPKPYTATLLRAYWSIPDRQIETSVVLANSEFEGLEALRF